MLGYPLSQNLLTLLFENSHDHMILKIILKCHCGLESFMLASLKFLELSLLVTWLSSERDYFLEGLEEGKKETIFYFVHWLNKQVVTLSHLVIWWSWLLWALFERSLVSVHFWREWPWGIVKVSFHWTFIASQEAKDTVIWKWLVSLG